MVRLTNFEYEVRGVRRDVSEGKKYTIVSHDG